MDRMDAVVSTVLPTLLDEQYVSQGYISGMGRK
jgi:hypothetical protein